MFYFPWGDTVVDLRFWQCLLGHGDFSSGWLRDEVRITVNLFEFLALLVPYEVTCVFSESNIGC